MSRAEISGYVQIVIGAVGIIVTVLASPAMLDALGQIGPSGNLPPEFSGISGAVRIFAVLFVMLCFVLLLMIGLALVLSAVFRALGSGHPFLTGFFAIATVVCLAVTVTLAVISINYWIAGFIASFMLVWMTFASTEKAEEDGSASSSLGTIGLIGSILFLITGGITAIGNSAAERRANDPLVKALNEKSAAANRNDRQDLKRADNDPPL